MLDLEQEIQDIQNSFQQGELTMDERDILLTNIRDIKLAQQYAHDETVYRYLFRLCQAALLLGRAL